MSPEMEQLDPLIDGHSSGAPQKSTNSPELVREPLSGGPNLGPPPEHRALPAPQPMAAEVWPKRASSRGSGHAIEAP